MIYDHIMQEHMIDFYFWKKKCLRFEKKNWNFLRFSISFFLSVSHSLKTWINTEIVCDKCSMCVVWVVFCCVSLHHGTILSINNACNNFACNHFVFFISFSRKEHQKMFCDVTMTDTTKHIQRKMKCKREKSAHFTISSLWRIVWANEEGENLNIARNKKS